MSTSPLEGLPAPQFCVAKYFFHQGEEVEIIVYSDDLDAVPIQGPRGLAPLGAQQFELFACYPQTLNVVDGKIQVEYQRLPLTLPDAPFGLVRRLYPH